MKLTGKGALQIQARKASGAYPVPGTSVRILGAEEANRYVVYTTVTDLDGNTPIISLPTPEIFYSLSSRAPETPYAIYDVEISADGYYPKTINNVAVFPNSVAIQPINMIALTESDPYQNYPRGNLSSAVRENPNLE